MGDILFFICATHRIFCMILCFHLSDRQGCLFCLVLVVWAEEEGLQGSQVV